MACKKSASDKHAIAETTPIKLSADGQSAIGICQLEFIGKKFQAKILENKLVSGPKNWDKDLQTPQLSPRSALDTGMQYAVEHFGKWNWIVTEIRLINAGGYWYYCVDLEITANGLRPKLSVFIYMNGEVAPWDEVK